MYLRWSALKPSLVREGGPRERWMSSRRRANTVRPYGMEGSQDTFAMAGARRTTLRDRYCRGDLRSPAGEHSSPLRKGSVRGQNKKDTDWCGCCLRQSQGATPHWDGTGVFACGEDALACRLRASSTRSARGNRTQVLPDGQNTACEATVRGQNKKDTDWCPFCFGCGTRIRTQTNRVRVCSATVTQFRNAIQSI